ncbi:hypothetical protein BDB01DRAFT_713204 [Pilobolus umbonatus]|nr:hypothetical protein BDB01DRAFT_713204 [Pilobolus umbonatus]
MFSLQITCPATCELCGHWMPQHSGDCPRYGVHPSQWTMIDIDPITIDYHYHQSILYRWLTLL